MVMEEVILIQNKMKKKKCYVEVNVKSELPENGKTVIWLMQGGGAYEGFWDEAEGRDWVYIDADNKDGYEVFSFSDFTHWLKPQELYCFTKEELEAEIKNAFEEGQFSGSPYHSSDFEFSSDYIASLNLK